MSARPWRIPSVRGRLVVVVTALLVAALAGFGVFSVAILKRTLTDQTESALYLSSGAFAVQLQSALATTGELPGIDEFPFVTQPDGFYVVLRDGAPVQSAILTRDYDYRALTRSEIAALAPEHVGETGAEMASVGGGEAYLVTAEPVESAGSVDGGSQPAYTVVSGIGLSETDAVVAGYAGWVALIGGLIAVAAAVLGHRLVRRELHPLDRIARVAEEVAATPLSSGEIAAQPRAPRDPRRAGSEPDRVASALNLLLQHVEQSMNSRHRAEESMRRFVAEASHELRNPLASIRGYADAFSREDTDPGEARAALGRIGAESARMSELVDTLLLLAKLDAAVELRAEAVDLSQIVAETASDARFAYPDHAWRIRLPDHPVTVCGDPDAIRQMTLNLISNAGHHTPAGTQVELAVEVREDAIDLSVTDTGPGIPAAALPTLFDRFTQATGTGETRNRSTVGLGLAIVDGFARAAGYAIEVRSDASGTRMTIRMPNSGRDAARPRPEQPV